MLCREIWIQAGADVSVTQHIPSSNMRMALLVQVAYRDDGCLKLLLEAGASVNACSSYGRTALMAATSAMNLCNVKLLLKAGAHVNKIHFLNQNAIQQHLSYYGPSWIDISKTLFAAGEIIDGATVERLRCKGHYHPVSDDLQRRNELTLRRICRLVIRQHFLQLDKHENLFMRIPKLGLPVLLCNFLLHNVALDDIS